MGWSATMHTYADLNRGGTMLTFDQQRRLLHLCRMSPRPFEDSEMTLIDLHLVQWCDEECTMVEPVTAYGSRFRLRS